MRWELEPLGKGTRLTLWHNIDRGYISWGAAGWHICFDVLDRMLAGHPIGRMVGPETIKFSGWQRLQADYAKQFTRGGFLNMNSSKRNDPSASGLSPRSSACR